MKNLIIYFLLLVLSPLSLAGDKVDFLIDAEWLVSRINDAKTVILEVRYHPHRYDTIGHIPNAQQVKRFKDLGDNEHHVIMRLPKREVFQNTLRQWGVDNDSTVVIYDDSNSALASRLYFLLAYFGFDMKRVKILDGGVEEWTNFNQLTKQTQNQGRRKTGNVQLKAGNIKMISEWSEVYDRVLSKREQKVFLLDARPKDMYTGKVIRHSVQGGHIPGAINIVSLDGTENYTKKWLPLEKIAAMYSNIPKDATIITYCHDGFRSTLAWLQLKSLGYQDVRFFNGGWREWDSALTLPVIQGEKPYDDEFAL